MLQIRKSDERGFVDHGWLVARHTFSFAGYYDPKHIQFRSLMVINEDRIQGKAGFGKHPHKNMEIISYVVKGGLLHEDTMGNKTTIRPGEVQSLSAGSGIQHSEFNEFTDQETHLFQIWILPNSLDQAPSYGQKSFESALSSEKIVLVASEGGRNGSISIRQDADMYVSRIKNGESLEFLVRSGRGVWLQMVSGQIQVNGLKLSAGDGLAVEITNQLTIVAESHSEIIIFDLA